MDKQRVYHVFGPVFDKDSEVLILGSFPSVKSRETSFYYAHPQNRFWQILEALFGSCPGESGEERTAFLIQNKVALWDVIESCEIVGSSDSSIKNPVANDLNQVLDHSDVKQIFTNGRTAHNLYNKLIKPIIRRSAIYLPSISPANAAFSLDRLISEWKRITLS